MYIEVGKAETAAPGSSTFDGNVEFVTSGPIDDLHVVEEIINTESGGAADANTGFLNAIDSVIVNYDGVEYPALNGPGKDADNAFSHGVIGELSRFFYFASADNHSRPNVAGETDPGPTGVASKAHTFGCSYNLALHKNGKGKKCVIKSKHIAAASWFSAGTNTLTSYSMRVFANYVDRVDEIEYKAIPQKTGIGTASTDNDVGEVPMPAPGFRLVAVVMQVLTGGVLLNHLVRAKLKTSGGIIVAELTGAQMKAKMMQKGGLLSIWAVETATPTPFTAIANKDNAGIYTLPVDGLNMKDKDGQNVSVRLSVDAHIDASSTTVDALCVYVKYGTPGEKQQIETSRKDVTASSEGSQADPKAEKAESAKASGLGAVWTPRQRA